MNGRIYPVPMIESYPYRERWGTDDAGEPFYRWENADYEVYDDLFVPNGTWVAQRPGFGYSWLIGASWDELTDHFIDKRPGRQRLLWTANKPFAFVNSDEAKWLPGTDIRVPQGPMHLFYARQIHKSELGQGVAIPKLAFAREHATLARKMARFDRNRDQNRNPHRWARLTDVVEASGLSAYSLMRDFWSFTGWSHTPASDRRGLLLHVRYGDTHQEISAQDYRCSDLTFEELHHMALAGKLETIWIRSGLANTFLRLRALGYQPTIAT